MARALLFLLISSFLTFSLYPFLINFLYRFQLRTKVRPEGPRTHYAKQGTPTAAGILMLAVFLFLNGLFNRSSSGTVPLLLVAVSLGGFGLVEDLLTIYHRSLLRSAVRRTIAPLVTLSDLSWNLYKLALFPWNAFKEIFRALGSTAEGIPAYQKVLFQAAVAVLFGLWLSFTRGTGLWLPLLGEIDLGYLHLPLVIVFFLFFVNSIDITDGLDGLLGGLLVINFTALLALALLLGREELAIICGTLIGALLSFLYFNIHPARVFMGDVGSLFLAGTFVAISLLLGREALLPVIGGVFVIEGLSVVLQVASVKLGKGRIFLMAPIHHHFEMKGWSETKVVMRFWLAGAFLSFLGLYLATL